MKTFAIPGTQLTSADYVSSIGSAIASLPLSLRVVAENAYRQDASGDAVTRVVARDGDAVQFRPARLLLQDMLGLPLLVDLMALRSVVASHGGDPERIDMSLPVDLVIDHAMTIEHWASPDAFALNEAREFEINAERFAFIKACEARFASLRVIPPGGGIMHQVNLEFLASVARHDADSSLWTPDTCLGTDSHTPMVNGVGVLGWGIGGLEAEGIMLGEAATVNVPRVVGVEIMGVLPHTATATDIALALAERLRAIGVVDCFVELFGASYHRLSVADRGTIANMAPEYGATSVFCPVDDNTLAYLLQTGRNPQHVANVEAFCRAQQLWYPEVDASTIAFDDVVTLDLGSLGRSVAGPSRPEQRIALTDASASLANPTDTTPERRYPVTGTEHDLGDGDVVVAAITSCTNTANPRNIILAGLLARNAVARGLTVKPHVKTSLAPGSRVVASYLESSGLRASLRALGFEIAAFSCSTCNGMSGPLRPEHEGTIRAHDLDVVAVLSGNRNFPGRIHPLASRNVLAAPPLVVAYALAGSISIDLTSAPLGTDNAGNGVMLDELWPDEAEVDAVLSDCLLAEDFKQNYQSIASVNPHWNALDVANDDYAWSPSTYVTFPPYIEQLRDAVPTAAQPTMQGLRPIAILGDSITTDHISPSGTITPESDAGRFLESHGIARRDFNSYGTRRGSSDIVIRSTFANIRLRNEMTPNHEGAWTRLPTGEVVSIHTAIEHYRAQRERLIVFGGREYGCGSSRDTAAKAPWLAGIRAVVVESFERIHRSNLVNMGIAPLTFPVGMTRKTLALNGTETYDIDLDAELKGATLTIHRQDGTEDTVPLSLRLYNDVERATFRAGGLLPRAFASFMQ